jgi:hypothetical protein
MHACTHAHDVTLYVWPASLLFFFSLFHVASHDRKAASPFTPLDRSDPCIGFKKPAKRAVGIDRTIMLKTRAWRGELVPVGRGLRSMKSNRD